MTYQQRRMRNPPLAPVITHEAALVGALTAFVKSPSTSPAYSKAHKSSAPIAQSTVWTKGNISPASEARSRPEGFSTRTSFSRTSTVKPDLDTNGNRTHQTSPLRTLPVMPQRQGAALNRKVSNNASRVIQHVDGSKEGIRSWSLEKHSVEPLAPSTSSLVQLFESQGTTESRIGPNTPVRSPKPVRKSRLLSQHDSAFSAQMATGNGAVLLESKRRSSEGLDATLVTPIPNILPDPTASQPRRIPGADRLPPPNHADDIAKTFTVADSARASMESLPVVIDPPTTFTNGSIPPYANPAFNSSSASIHAIYNSLHPRRTSAVTSDDALATAIVASSLASSRGVSPHNLSFPPRSLHPQQSRHSLLTRTPSPNKNRPVSTASSVPPLRQTLRKQNTSPVDVTADASDDPYAKHKRKRHIRKHANKYNEGDRKRWRNAVTERERNRYEGLWAANRGLLLDPLIASSIRGQAGSWRANDGHADQTQPEQRSSEVHAFVVREIWNRSRLPVHVLEEIWDLVRAQGDTLDQDNKGPCALRKEEFVVGLWLIDQRLKGRKLPVRVSESVWDSVKLLKGIRLRGARRFDDTTNVSGKGH